MINDLWEKYLKENNLEFDYKPESWHFCNTKELANRLTKLVLEGDKRATTSLYLAFICENEPLPIKGDLNIITDWDGKEKCIIQTTKVEIKPFYQVTKEFAIKEGEGDKSLKYWKKVHKEVFEKELESLDKSFSKDTLVVCEEFKVIYK
ncbi:MAG: ASCH domain-containing protein [Bacillota bacterium]